MQQSDLTEYDRQLIIRALYRALLAREPDSAGLRHHAESLERAGGLDGLEKLLSDFLGSAEFANRQSSRLAALWLAEIKDGSIAQDRIAVHHVVALGVTCFTSALLQKYHLRRYATPFDWIFSSQSMVEHALRDDFRKFLDRSLYEPVPVERRRSPTINRCEHIFYRERYRVQSVFNHHDPDTDEGHAYFVRSVDRFRSAVKQPGGVLFVQCCRDTQGTLARFKPTCAVLESYAPYGVLNLFLVAQPDPDQIVPSLHLLETVGKNRLYRLIPISRWHPLHFGDMLDEVAIVRALSRYDIQLSATLSGSDDK